MAGSKERSQARPPGSGHRFQQGGSRGPGSCFQPVMKYPAEVRGALGERLISQGPPVHARLHRGAACGRRDSLCTLRLALGLPVPECAASRSPHTTHSPSKTTGGFLRLGHSTARSGLTLHSERHTSDEASVFRFCYIGLTSNIYQNSPKGNDDTFIPLN